MALLFLGLLGLYTVLVWLLDLAVTALAKNPYDERKSFFVSVFVGAMLSLATCAIIAGAMQLIRSGFPQ